MKEAQFISQVIREKAAQITGINQALWEYGEPGYQEEKSAETIKRVLESEGFTVESGLAGIPTAFRGRYGAGKPVIGILAEFDALPDLSQEAGIARRCPIPGKSFGHGCGHSALGAGGVGAALAAKEYLKAHSLPGTIELYGCPAEESGFGKVFLVREHCFDHLDMAFSWHPGDQNGSMSQRTLAYYQVRFDFLGVSSHAGAAPELGRSALDACELMNVGVNYLREHVISSAKIHYAYLDSGGSAPNIVPDHGSLLYYIRAPKLTQCGEILERIKKIAKGAALMTETDVAIHLLGGMNDTIPNPTASRVLSDAFLEMGPPEFGEPEYQIGGEFLAAMPKEQQKRVISLGAKRNGISQEAFAKAPFDTRIRPYTPDMRDGMLTFSTDVGDVSYHVPVGQLMAAVGIPETGLHTWQLTAQVGSSVGNQGALAAAKAMGLACVRVYENPKLVEQAKKELLEETKGSYLCPIPPHVQPDLGA